MEASPGCKNGEAVDIAPCSCILPLFLLLLSASLLWRNLQGDTGRESSFGCDDGGGSYSVLSVSYRVTVLCVFPAGRCVFVLPVQGADLRESNKGFVFRRDDCGTMMYDGNGCGSSSSSSNSILYSEPWIERSSKGWYSGASSQSGSCSDDLEC